MKVLWLCSYPISLLQPELEMNRKISEHSCSWIVNLSNELARKKNIELHILTYSSAVSNYQVINKNSIIFHVLRYNFPFTNKGFPYFFRLDKVLWYNRIIKIALKVIKKIDPEIIHAHGTENAYALLSAKCDFPNVVSIQGIITRYYRINPSLSFLLQIPIEKYSIRHNENFGCRTVWDKKFVLKYNPQARIFYLPEAINKVFFEFNWKMVNNFSILFVGSLIKRKGIEILLKSLSRVKKEFHKVLLQIIGTGSSKYLAYLKNLANELNIRENVIWLGFKNSQEIASFLSKSTLFVLPTFMDNSPNSLAEAMAVGTPCIASKVGGVPSMINDGVDGFLVEKGNVEELAEKIIYLLHNRKKMIEISKNSKLTALKRNFPENVAKDTINVYKEILKL